MDTEIKAGWPTDRVTAVSSALLRLLEILYYEKKLLTDEEYLEVLDKI